MNEKQEFDEYFEYLTDLNEKDLQKELKVQQMKTKFYKAGSILGIGVAIITTTLYIIK